MKAVEIAVVMHHAGVVAGQALVTAPDGLGFFAVYLQHDRTFAIASGNKDEIAHGNWGASVYTGVHGGAPVVGKIYFAARWFSRNDAFTSKKNRVCLFIDFSEDG